jgi:hypothetical protein
LLEFPRRAVTPGPAKVESNTYFSCLPNFKAEQQNWRGVNAQQEIVNFSLKRKRQIPTNTHRRIKESASAEVFEQEWRLVLHCTSIQQHLGDLFSVFAVRMSSNSLQCSAPNSQSAVAKRGPDYYGL